MFFALAEIISAASSNISAHSSRLPAVSSKVSADAKKAAKHSAAFSVKLLFSTAYLFSGTYSQCHGS